MADDPRCEALRDALAEVPLGIASGEDRARVLGHVAECPSCQRLLAELTAAGDDLLRLAPVHEPPPGFELRVLSAIGATRRPARLGRPGWLFVPAIAAALAAAAIGVGAVLLATRDERRLGQQLSTVLDRAQGSYIAVAELRNTRRRRLGVVFHYGGHPSWVFTTFDSPPPPGRFRASLTTRSGAAHELGVFTLGPDDRSFGSAVEIDMRQVTGLRLRNERDGTTYSAPFF